MSSTCPGCLLELPSQNLRYDGYFNASSECWSLFGELLAQWAGDAVGARVMPVDVYAVQHAGGPHPDKSVDIHLVGLYLCLEEGVHPGRIPPLHRRLADQTSEWPHLPPPPPFTDMTVADVLLAVDSAEAVNRWARAVWEAWSEHHDSVARLADTLRGP